MHTATAMLGNAVGEWLAREERSIRWLSRKTGVSASQICRLINGAETSFGKCAVLAKQCGLSLDAVLHTDQAQRPPKL